MSRLVCWVVGHRWSHLPYGWTWNGAVQIWRCRRCGDLVKR